MPLTEIDSAIRTKNTNELAFRLTSFRDLAAFNHLNRYNYYSVILIEKGSVQLQVDLADHKTFSQTVICLSPYQPFMMTAEEEVNGYMLNFHPDFFCTYRHQNEIETEKVLFNNFSSVPFFTVENPAQLVNGILEMNSEILSNCIGIHEVLISLLKIFLIKLIREKKSAGGVGSLSKVKEKPDLLHRLVDCVESNFKEMHTAGDYSRVLFVSPQQLNKVVKEACCVSLSKLIVNRIMIEAKRELYLTSKSVKEIANDLGYKDEFYFSRVFKKQVGVSPKRYRETVGFARME